MIQKTGLTVQAERFIFKAGKLHLNGVDLNSYFAAVWADFLRHKLLENRQSFSFETVMSSADKFHFFQSAQQGGYRTYLYYVATEDPEINISRVQIRHALGGHDVPVEKIRTRYQRSLDLLVEAIRYSNRAYLFDNSGSNLVHIAEFNCSDIWDAKTHHTPAWFKQNVLDKFPIFSD